MQTQVNSSKSLRVNWIRLIICLYQSIERWSIEYAIIINY